MDRKAYERERGFNTGKFMVRILGREELVEALRRAEALHQQNADANKELSAAYYEGRVEALREAVASEAEEKP